MRLCIMDVANTLVCNFLGKKMNPCFRILSNRCIKRQRKKIVKNITHKTVRKNGNF